MYCPEWNLLNLSMVFGAITGSIAVITREFSPSTRLNYSKFNTASSTGASGMSISSFNGMLLIYSPSLIVSILFFIWSINDYRMLMISAAIFAHYLKRVLEVVFIHRYSGQSKLKDNTLISTFYFSFTSFIYKMSLHVPESDSKLALCGVAMFILGEYTNFYHHLLLRQLRKDGSKEYKIPSGGLFDYVWCPHYLGEIISFVAMVLLTQHILILILQLGSAGYLATRAYNTKKCSSDTYDTKHEAILPLIDHLWILKFHLNKESHDEMRRINGACFDSALKLHFPLAKQGNQKEVDVILPIAD
ncbi:3-oxo-5-alpha-steroid 4-dehydrogenase family protein [Mucor ambiguus]|uniref:3-oxo-5-alpha-steroid 4-dehydrogenase family protein n=1 Tax=Mucor ambiguus TaxID=91626 RepID=A0A0C9LWZ0_9FUNG|nr:3-oxo-5-alpha-steroid 4-dehydrogenase family protein [Mucor ambiguus]